MEHHCYICQEIIPEEEAEGQSRIQPPGNYLACSNHKVQVANLNIKLRQIQKARIDGYESRAEKLVEEMKELKQQYGVREAW